MLECSVVRTSAKTHTVIVVLGNDTLLQEGYIDETSALSRARQVQERLLDGGEWTAVNHAAVGLPST